jgi:4-hydroxy-4-methyl-2-oxoglutarate aldolase
VTDQRLIGKVYQPPQSPNNDAARLASELGVATIAAAVAAIDGARDPLLPRGAVQRIAGQGCAAGWATTVWNPPGNNTMLRYGLEASGAGDFLVVSTPTDGAAQWGDLAHEWANAKHLAGVLVDGSVRDVGSIRELGVPCWARSIDPREAVKSALGYVNAPVHVAGVRISPGDLIVADDDGVVILTPSEVDAALAAARIRADRETQVRDETRRGKPWPPRTDDPLHRTIEYVGRPWRDET